MVAFQIKSLQHTIVKHCVNLRKEAEYRENSSSFLIMGKKQLLECPGHITILRTFTLEGLPPLRETKHAYSVTKEILQKITGMLSPEPYAAEVSIPDLPISHIKKLLVCDAISDPGNLGTLLRTALSFGFDAAYFLPGCVDPFNEKVIRAAKGALFHLPLLYGDWQQLLSLKNTFSLEFYQAAMDGIPMTDCRISLPFALILGNESHGTSKESRAYSQGISIPMSGKTDSLNVAIAGGILMFNVSGLCQK